MTDLFNLVQLPMSKTNSAVPSSAPGSYQIVSPVHPLATGLSWDKVASYGILHPCFTLTDASVCSYQWPLSAWNSNRQESSYQPGTLVYWNLDTLEALNVTLNLYVSVEGKATCPAQWVPVSAVVQSQYCKQTCSWPLLCHWPADRLGSCTDKRFFLLSLLKQWLM